MPRGLESRAACSLLLVLFVALLHLVPTDAAERIPSGGVPGGASARAGVGGQTLPRRRNRLIIRLKPAARKGRAEALAADKHGVRFRNRLEAVGAGVYTLNEGQDMDTVLSQLRDDKLVEWVEEDKLVTVNAQGQFVPNDPLFRKQWFYAPLGATEAWFSLRGSPLVKVCHVDSGVRMGHPDLQAAVQMGWNFVKDPNNVDNYDPVNPASKAFKNYNDTYGHGTATAGLIAAITNNKRGVAGTAPGVKLLVCRFIFNDGAGWVSDAIACWSLCEKQGATIYSNSWGFSQFSTSMKVALEEHQKKGHLMVVSAGNSGANLNGGLQNPRCADYDLSCVSYPASYRLPCLINVAATDPSGALASFSNFGNKVVDLAAPGTTMLTTSYTGGYSDRWTPPKYYSGQQVFEQSISGTSFSAPLVTGMAALMQSKAAEKKITLRYPMLKSFILPTVDRPKALRNRLMTNGQLNMTRAAKKFNAWFDAKPWPGAPQVAPRANARSRKLRQPTTSGAW